MKFRAHTLCSLSHIQWWISMKIFWHALRFHFFLQLSEEKNSRITSIDYGKLIINFIIWSRGNIAKFVNRSYERKIEKFANQLQEKLMKSPSRPWENNAKLIHRSHEKKLVSFNSKWGGNPEIHQLFMGKMWNSTISSGKKIVISINRLQEKTVKFFYQLHGGKKQSLTNWSAEKKKKKKIH